MRRVSTVPGDPSPSADPSTGQLFSQLSEQASRLARDELRLAQVELKDSARHAGLGAGLFTATGVLGMYGLAALTATAARGSSSVCLARCGRRRATSPRSGAP